MGEGEWREDEILKLGGDKSSIYIPNYKSWVGGQGEGGGGRGEFANIRQI